MLETWTQIAAVLENFRQGVLRFLLVMFVLSGLAYFFSEPLIAIFQRPITAQLFIYAPTEAFITKIKLALFTGGLLSIPYLFFLIWKAITTTYPALAERAHTAIVIGAASVLFLAGILLCYFLVLRFALVFLLGFGTESIAPAISVSSYYNFLFLLLFAFGGIFELPLILLVLSRAGLVDVPFLSRYRKYAILLIAIVSAVITPTPDAYTMLLMAGPLYVLYELSILIVRFFGKRS